MLQFDENQMSAKNKQVIESEPVDNAGSSRLKAHTGSQLQEA